MPDPADPADDRPAWDRDPGPAPARPPAAGGPTPGRPGWHDPAQQKPGKAWQIAAGVGLAALLVGAIVGLILWFQSPDPAALVTVPVTEYGAAGRATNPTAADDAARLAKQFQGGAAGGRGTQESPRLRAVLDGLAGRGKQPLVLYLSALAAVRDGQVCLLPGVNPGQTPTDAPADWVPVADVVAKLEAAPASGKALLLDIGRPAGDPYRGPLLDDPAAALDAHFRANPPKFPVLVACSPGEHARTIPERQGSAFAVYLAEGMTGAADGEPGAGRPDGQLTFAELAAYATRRVGRWADQAAGVRQVPALYPDAGAGGDLVLIYHKAPPPPAEETPTTPEPYPEVLLKGWKARDAARERGLWLTDPAALTRLETALLRADDLWADGLTVAGADADRLERLTKETDGLRGAAAGDPPAATLADLRAATKGDPPADLPAALDRYRRAAAAPKPDPGDLAAAEAELDKRLAGKPAHGAWLLWSDLLKERELTADKVKAAAAVLAAKPFAGNDLRPTGEALALARLADAPPPPEGDIAPAARNLLRAEQAFADAVAATAGYGGGFDAVRRLFEEGEEHKQDGERALFAAKTEAELVAAGQRLNRAAERLKEAADGAAAVRAARRAWAAAAALLHATLPAMIDRGKPVTWADWKAAADRAADVADALAAAPPDLTKLDRQTADLRAAAAKLAAPFSDAEVKRLTAPDQSPDPDRLADLRGLLAGGGPTAANRKLLADAADGLSARLYDRVRAAGPPPPTPARPKVSDLEVADRTKRRADASLALLRLAGYDPDRLAELKRLRAAADPGGWAKLTEGVQAAWVRDLPAAVAKATPDRLGAVERILRAAPGGLPGLDPAGGLAGLFRAEERRRREWLAERFGAYGKLRAEVPQAARFYQELAESYPRGG